MNISPLQRLCVLCRSPIYDSNNTDEHIIPNSIGGRRKVSGFICKPCNDKTGDSWDAALAREAQSLCLLLQIKRERGETPRQPLKTVSGKEILLKPDGGMHYADIKGEVIEREGQTFLNIKARTMREARRLLNGFKRKYPDLDVEAVLNSLNNEPEYLRDPVMMSFSFGGPEIGRSNVKSVLAFAHHHGVDVHSCPPAVEYLTKADAEANWGFYYSGDVLIDRPPETVFHCVAICGDARTGLLLGYLEYFSAHRIVVCLSDRYAGKDIHEIYAIDPLSGTELDFHFEMSFSEKDIRAIYNYAHFPDGAHVEAMHTPLKVARKLDQERAMTRALAYAADYAMKNCGLVEGEEWTGAQRFKASQLMAKKMMPFMSNNYTFKRKQEG